MKIRSVKVGGFKNVQDSKLELNNVTAVVSPNNYGKSNLLEAIRFAVQFISATEKTRRKMMSWSKGIPICKSLENENFTFEVELINEDSVDFRYVKYGFSFAWYRDDGTGRKIIDEWLEARDSESKKFTSFLKREQGKYRKEKGTSSFRNISLGCEQLAIDILSHQEDASIKPLALNIKNIDYRICSSLDLRDRFQPIPIDFADFSDDGAVIFDDNDVPRTLYNLQKSAPEKYDLFLEAVYTLFPEFTNISINVQHLNVVTNEKSINNAPDVPFRIRDEIYSVIVTSSLLNQPININRMSTGTKRVFWILTNAFVANSKGINLIAIEELETSIHPKLLKSLLEYLNEVSGIAPIIVSSHSPFLVQYLKPQNLFIGRPTDNGTANFKKIKPSKLKQFISLAKENDMYVGEYLFELMSTGKDGESMLSFYLED